jgi:hypothetical protein
VQSKVHTAQAIKVDETPLSGEFNRADLEFHGLDHSSASYEARVFLNNPDANEDTPKTPENGYAGSFNIFGHGGCFGDVGHCEIHGEQRAYDPRPSHVLAPVKTVVTATDALQRAAAEGRDITVTVVPVITGLTEQTDTEDVLNFDHISIVTYR